MMVSQHSRLLSSMARSSRSGLGNQTTRTFSSGSQRNVVILSASRTPVGSFQGSLAGFKGSELGALAAKSAIAKAGIQLEDVNEAVMGNVVSANMGQAPARQAAIGAGLPWSVPCTTVNKVCSSGLKSVMFAAQSIMSGQNNVVLAGGFESMSQVPYYLPKARSGLRLGHGQITDGIVRDGLWDSFDDQHMGMCAEEAAESFNISREAQDAHAIESYRRAQAAAKAGWFKEEIVPVAVPQRGGEDLIIDQDQEITRFKSERVSTARPAFKKDGTVTPINSSSLNDGGAALIVASEEWAQERNLQPLARIVGMADAAQKPVRFTTAPSLAIPIAVGRAGISVEQVDNWEINEAFSVVSLVNNQLLGLDPEKVNVQGGAVSLGHPIGSSGARILVTLLHTLKRTGGEFGGVGICNGGGGASSLVVQGM